MQKIDSFKEGDFMGHEESMDISFSAQLARIRAILGLREDAELAEFFGIAEADIAAARARGRIPASWLLILLQARQISPEWVSRGVGPCLLGLPVGRYPTAEEAAAQRDVVAVLRGVSSRQLAEELLRRLAVAGMGGEGEEDI